MFKKHKSILNSQIPILLIVLVFLILALWNINYPGLNTDEAAKGVVSSNILRDASDIAQGKIQLLGYHVILYGKIFPIMEAQYSGATIPYLIFPFIRFFGLNILALRLCPVIIMAIFLFFLYYFCKNWFGVKVAIAASLITATNLVFVQYSRLGLYRSEIFVMAFFWFGLFFLIKYAQIKRYLFLILGFLFFGLSFSIKITFLYYAVALTIAYFLIGKRNGLLGIFKIKEIAIMLVSFCAGAFFVISYNVIEPWITAKQLFSVLTNVQATSVNTIGEGAKNWDYLNNFSQRLMQFFGILRGDVGDRFFWGISGNSAMEVFSSLAVILVIICLGLLLATALFIPSLTKIGKNRVLFICIIYLAVLLLSPFTMSGFDQGHLLVLLPFPQLALAVFLCTLWSVVSKNKKLVKAIVGFLFVFTIFFNIFMNLYYNMQMQRSGGYGRWSTAIGELADYLKKNNITAPVMFDYDLYANLIFSTDNQVVPRIYDKFYPEPAVLAYNELTLTNREIFYLTITPEESEREHLLTNEFFRAQNGIFWRDYLKNLSSNKNKYYKDLFMQYVKKSGRVVYLERVFLNRAGVPVYWLYKIF
jgi:4-amino-4-deoxy-L-arabinose transferase-like glycosyltransferase